MKRIKGLKLIQKLMLSAIVGVICIAAVGLFSLTNMSKTTNSMENVNEQEYIPTRWVSDAVQFNQKLTASILELMLIDDLEEKKKLNANINEGIESVLENFSKFEAMDIPQEERDLITDFYDAIAKLEGKQEQVIQLALENKNEEAMALYIEHVKEPREDLIQSLTKINDLKVSKVTNIIDETVDDGRKMTNQIIIASIIAALLLIGGMLVIARAITAPIKKLVEHLEIAKKGNLSVRSDYSSKCEIGSLSSAFNETMDNLTVILEKTKETSVQVNDLSNELSQNVEESTASIESVVTSIQEIAVSSEDTQKSIAKNADALNNVRDEIQNIDRQLNSILEISEKSYRHSEEGSVVISESVQQMEEITKSVELSNEQVHTLVSKTSQINEVLNTITGIADQTNLLALNASIEAARAGEHGKGFAVVADEVRKLAEQSLEATKSIATIITEIQMDGKNTVNIMDKVTEETHEGLKRSEITADKFNDIMEDTKEMAPKMREVTTALENMIAEFNIVDSGTSEILKKASVNVSAAEEVKIAAQQQAASMEEINASTNNVANQSNELMESVSHFKF